MSGNAWLTMRVLSNADELQKHIRHLMHYAVVDLTQTFVVNGVTQLRVQEMITERMPTMSHRSAVNGANKVLEQLRNKIGSGQDLDATDELNLLNALRALLRAGLVHVAEMWQNRIARSLNRSRYVERIDSTPTQQVKHRHIVQVATNNDPTHAVQGAGTNSLGTVRSLPAHI